MRLDEICSSGATARSGHGVVRHPRVEFTAGYEAEDGRDEPSGDRPDDPDRDIGLMSSSRCPAATSHREAAEVVQAAYLEIANLARMDVASLHYRLPKSYAIRSCR